MHYVWSFGAGMCQRALQAEPNPDWYNTLDKRHMSNDNEILNAQEAAIAWGNGDEIEHWVYGQWVQLSREYCHLSTNEQYRRSKRTITVNGHEVPEPMRSAPKDGSIFFAPNPVKPDVPHRFEWGPQMRGRVALMTNGLCHATREAAIKHGKALADKGEES